MVTLRPHDGPSRRAHSARSTLRNSSYLLSKPPARSPRSKARRRDGPSSDLTTAPLDELIPLVRHSETGVVVVTLRPHDGPSAPSGLLTLRARRHSVAQPARLDSFARLARSLAPRVSPPHSGGWQTTFASGLLTLQARRHFVHLLSHRRGTLRLNSVEVTSPFRTSLVTFPRCIVSHQMVQLVTLHRCIVGQDQDQDQLRRSTARFARSSAPRVSPPHSGGWQTTSVGVVGSRIPTPRRPTNPFLLHLVGQHRGRRRRSNSDTTAAHLDESLFDSLDNPNQTIYL